MSVADARTEQAELQTGRGDARLDRRLGDLPAGHPSSPRYADAGAADRVRPLTDAEHAEHVADVRHRLEAANSAGLATDLRYTIAPSREFWSSSREAGHDAIVDDLYSSAAVAPCDGKAILAGGLPGAGKTTVLENYAGLDISQYLVINPDAIKEEMARRGMVPVIGGLSPMEASDLIHEESSHIAKRLAHRAESDRRNVIWDITMSSAQTASRRIDALRTADYRSVGAIFVDIPVDVSLRRVDARHRTGHDEYRAGIGLGGRYVPRETIVDHADSRWGSRNSRAFEELKRRVDHWTRYDNSVDGRAPRLGDFHRDRDYGGRRAPM